MRQILFIFTVFCSTKLMSEENLGYFRGRIHSYRAATGLIKIQSAFENQKYLEKGQTSDFWRQGKKERQCSMRILEVSQKYIVGRVLHAQKCKKRVLLAGGVVLDFYSKDLYANIEIGKDALKILEKKRQALKGLLEKSQQFIDLYPDKVEQKNRYYKTLRDQLELEWRDELSKLENSKVEHLKNIREIEKRIDQVHTNIQKYYIHKENIEKDHWAL